MAIIHNWGSIIRVIHANRPVVHDRILIANSAPRGEAGMRGMAGRLCFAISLLAPPLAAKSPPGRERRAGFQIYGVLVFNQAKTIALSALVLDYSIFY